jgi:hypothetical protein
MAPVRRDPPETDPPDLVCVRCSKPITPGTASQLAGRPVHMRCLGRATQLESIEQQSRAALEQARARAARARAEEILDTVRRAPTTCPVCGEGLATSRGVLFQGDWLVHAACWRADPKSFDDPPPPAG